MNHHNDSSRYGTHQFAHEWICRHPQSIWTVSATLSLLCARHLLVELNFHYPLLVYLAQLVVTTIVEIARHPWGRKSHDFDTDRSVRRLKSRGILLQTAATCFTALSIISMLQAVLHLKNLPTLAMLTTIAIFADDFIHLLSGYTTRSRIELLRITLLLLACAGILATEYRLSVANLTAAIPAMLFAGMARAIRTIARRHYPKDTLSRNEDIQWLVGAGYVVAATWVFVFWPGRRLITIDLRSTVLLALNAALTTAALHSGMSIVLPIKSNILGESPKSTNTTRPRTCDELILLTQVGIVGCYSTVSVRRSYTNWSQYGCFAVAVLCVSLNGAYDVGDNHKDVSRNDFNEYQLLDDFSSTSTNDKKTISAVDESAISRSPSARSRSWRPSIRSLSMGVVLFFLWTLYIYCNFAAREVTHPTNRIDRRYRPKIPLEIVISMYKEPIEGVASFISSLEGTPQFSGAPVTIYLKDEEADVENIRQKTGAARAIKLPNIGREGETYLNHINTYWDSLAKHTIFLQADVHNSLEFYTRLRGYFDPQRTGFLNLGSSDVCNCAECGDQFSWKDSAGLFPEYYSRIYNSTNCKQVLLSYKGQFIVSAARIRGITKAIYRDLWQAFVDESSWAHQPEFLQGWPDSMSAPHFGYSMERIWNLLFQCSDMDVAWRCPSLISGWRLGGNARDCQCFDV